MNNPETQAILGIRHCKNTNQEKTIANNTKLKRWPISVSCKTHDFSVYFVIVNAKTINRWCNQQNKDPLFKLSLHCTTIGCLHSYTHTHTHTHTHTLTTLH